MICFKFLCLTESKLLSDSIITQKMGFIFSFLLATWAIFPLQKVRAGPIVTPYDSQPRSNCRYLPGDANWPSPRDWATLNSTVGGKLIQTVPLAAPCHDPTYNQEVCTQYQALWAFPNYQYILDLSNLKCIYLTGDVVKTTQHRSFLHFSQMAAVTLTPRNLHHVS